MASPFACALACPVAGPSGAFGPWRKVLTFPSNPRNSYEGNEMGRPKSPLVRYWTTLSPALIAGVREASRATGMGEGAIVRAALASYLTEGNFGGADLAAHILPFPRLNTEKKEHEDAQTE